jgi:hypothetical protein
MKTIGAQAVGPPPLATPTSAADRRPSAGVHVAHAHDFISPILFGLPPNVRDIYWPFACSAHSLFGRGRGKGTGGRSTGPLCHVSGWCTKSGARNARIGSFDRALRVAGGLWMEPVIS